LLLLLQQSDLDTGSFLLESQLVPHFEKNKKKEINKNEIK
jgi:hypothetical protein